MNKQEFLKELKKFEGYAEHMYLDSEGYVTVGVGVMFPKAETAVKSSVAFVSRATAK